MITRKIERFTDDTNRTDKTICIYFLLASEYQIDEFNKFSRLRVFDAS